MGDFAVQGTDLKKMLKAAKKAPVAFGFSPGKSEDEAYCGMHRTKPPAAIGKEAKDSGDSTKFVFGTATVAAKVVRLTCIRLIPNLAKRFKKYLKSQKVMLNVEILDSSGKVVESDIEDDLPDDPELEGEDDEEGDEAPVVPVPDEVKKRLTALVDQIRDLPPAFGGRLAGPFRQMVDLARSGDLEGASEIADKLDVAILMIDQMTSGAPGDAAKTEPPPPDPRQQKLLQTLAAMRERVARVGAADVRARLDAALDETARLAGTGEIEAVVGILRKVDAILNAQGASSAAAPGAPGDPGGDDPDDPRKGPDDTARKEAEDRERRAREALDLRGRIAAVTVTGADEAEVGRIAALAADLTRDWADPPSDGQLQATRDRLPQLEDLGRQIAADVAARRQTRSERDAEVGAQTVAGADEGEALAIAQEQTRIRATYLPDVPSAQQLDQLQEPLAALRDISAKTKLAVEARVQRAGEIRRIADEAKVTHATKAEGDRIAEAVGGIPDLSKDPSRKTMEDAENALRALEKVLEEVRLSVAARAGLAAKAASTAQSLTWNQGALVPVAGAPSPLTEPLRKDAETLAARATLLGDPARADDWPTVDPGALAIEVGVLAKGAADLADKLKQVNDAVGRVTAAREAAALAIAATGIHALSEGQKGTFTLRAEAAAASFASDLAQAETAVVELGKVGAEAAALQRALRVLRLRVDAVDLAPAGASDKEKQALAALRKAALDALGEVEA